MAVLATAGAAQASSVGPWAEISVATAAVIAATAVTSHTIVLPNAPASPGVASVLNPNLPIAVTHLATGTSGGIQGGSNTLLPTSVGVAQVSIAGTPGTVTISYANQGAAFTITAASRILLVQNGGI